LLSGLQLTDIPEVRQQIFFRRNGVFELRRSAIGRSEKLLDTGRVQKGVLRNILFIASFGMVLAEAQISTFQHVVVIVKENRTPDNLFQGLCSAPYGAANSCSTTPNSSQRNIQTANWIDSSSPSGVIQPGTVALANKYDLSHAHSAFVAMCDADPTGVCRMDGASKISCSGSCPKKPQFRFVDNSAGVVNPYLVLATQYGWANYMFQTNQGPSFPAHQFLFGGTSAPSAADDAAGIFASENMSGASRIAGCTAPTGTTVEVVNPTGGENQKIYPCFEHRTMPDLLPSAFTWRYYAPSAGSIWTAPNAIQHICESTGPGGHCAGQDWSNNVDLKPADVLTDIANCNLRSVSWVIPTGANSDHAHVNDGGGPSWVAAIVNAIGASTACDGNAGYWNNTAIFITWDDWGGWYDHESPIILAQPQGDYQYGFRVPLVVVSAYTPAGYINNDRHDFGSILRFVEFNFGITEGALNFADSRAKNDLRGFFDLARTPRAYQTIQAPKSANFFLHDKRKATDPDDQ
jgi:phospholipase C